nr:non-structural protein NSP5 [Grapevine Cabernet Sauvignon reovirus]
MVAWLVYHPSLVSEKFLRDCGAHAMIVSGLPTSGSAEPYFRDVLSCLGIRAKEYRDLILEKAFGYGFDFELASLTASEAYVCAFVCMFYKVNIVLISQRGGEYYLFRSHPNNQRTYVIGSFTTSVGGVNKYARVNCTELGLVSMFKRVMYPFSELPTRPSSPENDFCQIYAYAPEITLSSDGIKPSGVKTRGRPIGNITIEEALWQDYLIKGLDNVSTDAAAMNDGSYKRLMAEKKEIISKIEAEKTSAQICEDLRNGIQPVNISVPANFRPTKAAFVTSEKARGALLKTKMPTNVEKNRNEWLVEGASLAEKITISVKPEQIKMTGLRHWYSMQVMNYSKKGLSSIGYKTATFLPGGIINGTGLGNVVCTEIVWCKNVIIPTYECFSHINCRVKSIIMICETANCNIPGRPFIVYDHNEDVWTTSDIFATYFNEDMMGPKMVALRTIVKQQMTKSFRNTGIFERAKAIWDKKPKKEKKRHPLCHVPIRHVVLDRVLETRGNLDMSTISSMWPSVTGTDYQKDVPRIPSDQESEDVVMECPGLRVEDLLKHSFSLSCTWKQPFAVTNRGLIMPCGAVEPAITHNLHQHTCMLPYLGDTFNSWDSSVERADSIPCCSACPRRFPHKALAELCAEMGCPGEGVSSSNIRVDKLDG